MTDQARDDASSAEPNVSAGASATGSEARETPTFRYWAENLARTGNSLLSATPEWLFKPTDGAAVFFWAFRTEIHIADEDRVKGNEVVVGRPDLAAVVAYHPAETLERTRVVLVREFRSAGATADGFVHELPSGSTFGVTPDELRLDAAKELAEETGLRIDPTRLQPRSSRQLAATFLASRLHLFSVELTDAEIDRLAEDQECHGDTATDERTYIEIKEYREVLGSPDIDWTTVGAVSEVLGQLQIGPGPGRMT